MKWAGLDSPAGSVLALFPMPLIIVFVFIWEGGMARMSRSRLLPRLWISLIRHSEIKHIGGVRKEIGLTSDLKSGYRLNAMYVLKKQKRNLFLKKPGFQMIALSSSEQSLNDYTWDKRGWPCSHPCWFTSLKTTFDFTSFNVQGVKDNSPRSIY